MYIVVESFMMHELNLKGNELLVYALIYGFSRDGESKFFGSLDYISETLNISKSTVQRVINSLCEQDLIEKSKISKQIVYMVKMNPIVVKMTTNMVKMTTYNTIYNTNYNKEKKKEKKPTLYEKCSNIISEKFTDKDIIDALYKYLSVRIKVGLTVEQWDSITEDLFNIADTKVEALAIIDKAYKCGYRTFYADKSKKKSNTYSDNIIKTEKTEIGKLQDIYREQFSMVLVKDRPPFEEWLKTYKENDNGN